MVKTNLKPEDIPDEIGPWKETLLRLSGRVEDLEQQLQSLLRGKYGPKTESISPDQLRLFEAGEQQFVEDKIEAAAQVVAQPSKRSQRKPGKELPRRRVEHEPNEAELVCSCGERKARIGEEVTERLDYVPSSVFINEHVRGKYACKKCQGEVVIGPKPKQVIERGFVEAGMLAYIATSKYADHLPLHRLESIFKTWLDRERLIALPKSPLGKAVMYALNNWEALNRFVENGNLTIDNNRAENALRKIAIGRKNWLFLGSESGGRTASIFASVIASCNRHSLDPFAYLKDVFTQLAADPNVDLETLLPDRWQRERTSAAA